MREASSLPLLMSRWQVAEEALVGLLMEKDCVCVCVCGGGEGDGGGGGEGS